MNVSGPHGELFVSFMFDCLSFNGSGTKVKWRNLSQLKAWSLLALLALVWPREVISTFLVRDCSSQSQPASHLAAWATSLQQASPGFLACNFAFLSALVDFSGELVRARVSA